jgi:hypothetical protein
MLGLGPGCDLEPLGGWGDMGMASTQSRLLK